MKILLDEMIHKQLKGCLEGHNVFHVSDVGFAQLKNGELLAAAEASGFEAFITRDRNLPYQQNLTRRNLAILVLQFSQQRRSELNHLAAGILQALPECLPGMVSIVDLRNPT